jgi:tetratricopeptide (TPR) repeat protein
MCTLVIGVYAYTAHSGYLTSSSPDGADAYYNLMVQGFRDGQLSLKKEVPPGLAQLTDPYDPAAHAPYPVLDTSYYKGKLYLYFGVTPALLLFWPYVALTGRYLLQKDAAVIFCVAGFLASAGLLRALWRRYFAEVNVWVVVAGTLALGLTTCMPALLARCDVHEVAISCAYALAMLTLAAIWKALHEPRQRGCWLAAASLAYGLAIASRPSLLFGALILLVPVVQSWRERRSILVPLLAASGPLLLIGLGLMLYNARRFDNPFEFGIRYQLSAERLVTKRFYGLHYLWFNFRVLFLEPARLSGRFPFLHDITLPPIPAGHAGGEHPFGILTNIPVVWSALAVPLAWRRRSTETRSILRAFLGAVALLFGICALTNCLFTAANFRYEVDFLPALLLLAVVGILGLERALADRPVWRRAVRWGWGLLLCFSVAFNLLVSVEYYAEAYNNRGVKLVHLGKPEDAIGYFERALRLKPDYADAQNNLGTALWKSGKVPEAVGHYEQALRIKPDYVEAHNNLATALWQTGRTNEAIQHWEQAVRLNPHLYSTHYNLAVALEETGRLDEAIRQYEQVVRLQPDNVEVQYYLGITLTQAGRINEAIGHYEQALRIKPDFVDAHYNLGVALEQVGRLEDAREHYVQALRLKPDFAEAQSRLARLRTAQ